MGSFAYLIGYYNSSDKQDARRNILKILHEGGMMELSQVSLFDKDVVLIKSINSETKYFDFNYFEDYIWETALLTKDGDFSSEKKGSRQFSKVICAVYVYMELISETPCIAVEDGELIDSHVIGWINHVLGTNYTVADRYQNLWEKLELIKTRKQLYEDILYDISGYNAMNTYTYRDLMAYMYLYRNDILQEAEKKMEDEETENHVEESKRAIKLTNLAIVVRTAIKEYKEEHSYEDLINFPFDKNINQNPDIIKGLKFFRFIPPQVYASIVANEMDKSFDEVWNDFKDKDYPYICGKSGGEETPLYIKTSDYLNIRPVRFAEPKAKPYTLTDDDRIFWNAQPSVKMQNWIDGLQTRYQEIEPKMIGIEKYIDLFMKANSIYKKIYPFADMFYEFLLNLNDKRYQKALLLFDEVLEENREKGEVINNRTFSSWDLEDTSITFNEGRMNIKRFLALMANKEMRKKIFGF